MSKGKASSAKNAVIPIIAFYVGLIIFCFQLFDNFDRIIEFSNFMRWLTSQWRLGYILFWGKVSNIVNAEMSNDVAAYLTALLVATCFFITSRLPRKTQLNRYLNSMLTTYVRDEHITAFHAVAMITFLLCTYGIIAKPFIEIAESLSSNSKIIFACLSYAPVIVTIIVLEVVTELSEAARNITIKDILCNELESIIHILVVVLMVILINSVSVYFNV